jgi:hypothetical protein
MIDITSLNRFLAFESGVVRRWAKNRRRPKAIKDRIFEAVQCKDGGYIEETTQSA